MFLGLLFGYKYMVRLISSATHSLSIIFGGKPYAAITALALSLVEFPAISFCLALLFARQLMFRRLKH